MIKKHTVYVTKWLRENLDEDRSAGFMEAIGFPGKIVASCLVRGTRLNERPSNVAEKMLTPCYHEHDKVREALAESNRMAACIMPGPECSTICLIHFYRRGQKEAFFHVEVFFSKTGDVCSTGMSGGHCPNFPRRMI